LLVKSLGITINVRPGARAGGAGRAARAFGGQLEEEVAAAAEVAQLMGKWRRFMAQTPYLMGKKPWVLPIVFWCQFSRKRSQLFQVNDLIASSAGLKWGHAFDLKFLGEF
jgi:glutathione S-transferase